MRSVYRDRYILQQWAFHFAEAEHRRRVERSKENAVLQGIDTSAIAEVEELRRLQKVKCVFFEPLI